MLVAISPSKSVMKQEEPVGLTSSQPIFSEKTSGLVQKLQGLSQKQLTKTLEVSDSLGALNYRRYQSWDTTPKRSALWMYSGDVYNGIDAYSMSPRQIEAAQQRLVIVSGLYGLLRPLDAIQPYRLEMRLPLKVNRSKNLYEYWQDSIKSFIADSHQKMLLLCASPEYAEAITRSLPEDVQTIRPRFMQETDSGLREKGLFAKYARGALARWVIDNDITEPERLVEFSKDGFTHSDELSTKEEIVYIVPKDFTLKGRFVKK